MENISLNCFQKRNHGQSQLKSQHQGVENVNIFLSVCKQRVNDYYFQIRNAVLQTSSRARTYIIHSDFVFQPYLHSIKKQINLESLLQEFVFICTYIRNFIWKMAQIKQTKTYNERKCKLCRTIKDEMHVLLECPMFFSEIRMLYNKTYYWKHPVMIRSKYLNLNMKIQLRNWQYLFSKVLK